MKRGMKVFVLGFIFLAFALSAVSAAETNITVWTLPFHEVQVAVAASNSQDFVLYERVIDYTNYLGKVNVVYTKDNEPFDVYVYVKKDNEKVLSEKFLNGYKVGESIELEVIPSGYVIPEEKEIERIDSVQKVEEVVEENITEVSEEVAQTDIQEDVQEQVSEGEISLTALAIFGEDGVIKPKMLYWAGGFIGFLILLWAVVFVINKVRTRNKAPKEIKIKKLSELQEARDDKIDDYKQIIEDAERKIKEAQEEINNLKKDDRIKEAKKKLMEDERELMRLRTEGKE